MLYIIIVLSITAANLFATRQTNPKRFMALSFISQAGYIVLTVVGSSASSVTVLSFYVLTYVVVNMAASTIIGVAEEHNNGMVMMDSCSGSYQTNPKPVFPMTLVLPSSGGVPPFARMFSKFFIFMVVVQDVDLSTSIGAWAYIVLFIALINTVIFLYYCLLIVRATYIKKSENPLPTFKSRTNTKLALAVRTADVVLFGMYYMVFDWIHAAPIAILQFCGLMYK